MKMLTMNFIWTSFGFDDKTEVMTIPYNYNKFSSLITLYLENNFFALPSGYDSISEVINDYKFELADMCKQGIGVCYSKPWKSIEIFDLTFRVLDH